MWLIVLAAIIITIVLVYDEHKRLPWVESLHQKCVFITGCDSGFGRALAKCLYQRGVPVFAGCYTETGADSLKQETGDCLQTLLVDVSNTDSIQQAEKFVREHLPPNTVLWAVVNNAGKFDFLGPMEFMTRQDYQTLMNVNLYGMIDVNNCFLSLLKTSRGRIVNMASISGQLATPGIIPYTTTKHAVIGYTESIRREKAPWGISVSVVLPASFRTQMMSDWGPLKEELCRKWMEQNTEIQEQYGDDYCHLYADEFESAATCHMSRDLQPVVSAYEHALFSVQPRSAYYPGKWSQLDRILTFLPAIVLDTVISMAIKTKPKCLRE